MLTQKLHDIALRYAADEMGREVTVRAVDLATAPNGRREALVYLAVQDGGEPFDLLLQDEDPGGWCVVSEVLAGDLI